MYIYNLLVIVDLINPLLLARYTFLRYFVDYKVNMFSIC